MLQWLRANGCEWDAGTCTAAAGGGQLVVLQWLRANDCAWNRVICLTVAPVGCATRVWIQDGAASLMKTGAVIYTARHSVSPLSCVARNSNIWTEF